MPPTQVIMPNDHVMCFKVWSELYSCLTHDYPDNNHTISNCIQDDTSYHGYNESTDSKQSSVHNVQHSNPFTMDTIQQRLQHLLDQPHEAEENLSSFNQHLANQETADDHTPTETDNIDNQHQVMLFTCTNCLLF